MVSGGRTGGGRVCRLLVIMLIALAGLPAAAAAKPAPHHHHGKLICRTHKRHKKRRHGHLRHCPQIHRVHVHKLPKLVVQFASAGKYPNPPVSGEHDPESGRIKKGPHRVLHRRGPAHGVQLPASDSAGTRDRAFTSDLFSGPIAILRDVSFGSTAGFGNSDGGEGALAVDGDFVFATTNYQAAYSTDGGITWTDLDTSSLLPAPTPSCHVGPGCEQPRFCCDTRAVYVPSIDRVIWDVEYTKANSSDANVIRLAFASPAQIESSSGRAWSYVDLKSTDFGVDPQLLDYGDIAVGATDLYFSALLESSGGTAMAQLPLTQFTRTASGCCWGGWYYVSPIGDGLWYGKFASNTGRTAYFAKQPDTSTLRLFRWDGVNHALGWVDVPVSSWSDNGDANGDGWRSDVPGPAIPAGQPDTNNWNFNSKVTSRIEGATQSGNDVWFAWASQRNDRFPQPYIQMAVINTHTLRLASEHYIWNPVYAFEYPALATNRDGEVGYIDSWGGGGLSYVNEEVGIATNSEVYDSNAADGHGGGGGHYQSIASSFPDTDCFAAAIDVQQQTSDGTRYNDPHFVKFGRSGRPCVPVGFGNPHVVIFSPHDGDVIAPGSHVTLSGAASDAVDGQLGGGALRWFLDGAAVGQGTSLDEVLPAGDHTITLQATDSGQRTASTQVRVHVQPPQTTSLSLTCPGKAAAGSKFGVSGALSPTLAGAAITITYSYTDPKSGPQTITHSVVTDGQGDYSDQIAAGVAGRWRSQASYAGDAGHKGSSSPSCSTIVS